MRGLIEASQKKGARGIGNWVTAQFFICNHRLMCWAGAAPNVALIIWLIVSFELTASIRPHRSLVKNCRATLTRAAKTAQLSGDY